MDEQEKITDILKRQEIGNIHVDIQDTIRSTVNRHVSNTNTTFKFHPTQCGHNELSVLLKKLEEQVPLFYAISTQRNVGGSELNSNYP